ncbi:MAG: hypothetical protein ACLFUH_01835 [Bacteroidales bacterium]
MNRLKKVLMRDFGYTENQAETEILEARDEALELIEQGCFSEAMDICQDWWGLEPDYLEEFLI